MTFVGKVQHLRRHLEPLQCREELEALGHVQPEVELTVYDERRRFEFVGEQMRREFPVEFAVLPRRTFEFPLVEPELFCRSVGRLGVKDAIVGYDALESVRVTEDLVRHIAAIACTERGLA